MTKVFSVLVLLLLAGSVQAESLEIERAWESESPDDVECRLKIEGFTIIYTYNSRKRPKTMPVENMMCFTRDYETQAAYFKHGNDYFDKYWGTLP